ncbi:YhcH/YjgK/YiaL family protein [Saccharicrinis fermentans]|uniref:Toxin-antitoxin biofilm protein TabA n=1 Tax=Saccharicrinis fermentans DSM 9555 = JCM 21142 TaxID=869213 RepID=W7YFW4_9BACT|nr:YhcH/YjgK/YiaL family protein [Saccharicrinis fermentans]GAF03341.1 toxin-antitoxin biofilm protein TabA [Saccharicrinis fermentans DSM 9555 = JCM 21142]
MIVDSLENVKHYRNLNERIKKAFEFLEEIDFESIEPGKYNVDGDLIFAIVSEYNTKEHEDARPEAHERYLDIQYIVKGEEFMGYVPLEDQEVMTPYNVEKDVIFYHAEVSPVKISEGMFALFYPGDIHAPSMKIETSKPVKKVVVKVAV